MDVNLSPSLSVFAFLELADGISRDADGLASAGCHPTGLATVLHKPSKATESAE